MDNKDYTGAIIGIYTIIILLTAFIIWSHSRQMNQLEENWNLTYQVLIHLLEK